MITVQIENFGRCRNELEPIFFRHWAELALFKDRMPLAPQYDEYVRRDDDGELVLVTVRRDGTLVAYYTAHVRPGFHYGRTLTGTQDLMFIVPEEMHRGLCLPLMRRVEAELKRRGVEVWYSGYKYHKPQGMPKLLELFGFEPADSYHVKWIGKEP